VANISTNTIELTLADAASGKKEKPKKDIAAADIVYKGEKLVLPEGMTLQQAAELIERRKVYESQETLVQEVFDAFPADGACMLDTVLNRRYGWSPAVPTPGFFGDNPPQLINIDVAYGQVRQVPWGRFLLPNVKGHLDCGVGRKDNRYLFAISAKVLRRDEKVVRGLFDELRKEIKENSIYRGKAMRVAFLDEEGDELTVPMPKFLDTDAVNENMLVLSEQLERAVNTNLFTPITRTADCLANNIPVKRGVLLGGTFGTGKTLIAHVASKLAVQSGITFVYIQKATELSYAIEFARQYQSPACVIFCEDIDREVTGERSEDMDAILNTIDGIDSKTSNIIVVLTTNEIKAIHPAMLRPGRLDAVIDVTAPDAKAIERLIHVYAGDALEAGIDLKAVGEVLAGNIPAVIAEVVKRAKLSQLSIQERGTQVQSLSAVALLDAAQTIQAQVLLLNPPKVAPVHHLEQLFTGVMHEAIDSHADFRKLTNRVQEIRERM
jgi:transitional endoplasmic reticulum ATPase